MIAEKRHWNFKDISGQQFGRLTVINVLPKGYGNTTQAMWECVCSCGNKTITAGNDLRIGQSTSCGCLRKEKTSKAKRKLPFQWLYNGLVKRCKTLERSCSLSYEDFLSYTKINNCHYCENEIRWIAHRTDQQSGAYLLDRKDSSKGYEKDNCVVCCPTCNWVKSDVFSYEEMLKLGTTIKEIQETRSLQWK